MEIGLEVCPDYGLLSGLGRHDFAEQNVRFDSTFSKREGSIINLTQLMLPVEDDDNCLYDHTPVIYSSCDLGSLCTAPYPVPKLLFD